ncbi:ras association domain-containing protein 8-like [Acanthaster planci]|uniref:Ras association domain-containing protein 8-like n=1 Tax=Acanthaster planci TaxID=133434 RepID=A0A8B7XQ42_ACAPL|nr:ras association domain-containing protein 8-like [Acanthaster planci]
MVELKVNIDGVQRVVCGVSEATRCQDIVLALAQATGQVGRFNLVEKCQDSERSLRPNEHPLRVMAKWGPNSRQAYFLLRKTGSTPGNSRPPSATKEISERFKQTDSPTESIGELPQQRHVNVRRSQTFSGYRGAGAPHPSGHPQEVTARDIARQRELTELVSIQQERLAHQLQDLTDIENTIQTMVEFELLPMANSHRDDSDSGIEEMELRSKRNKAELRELEFWESELEIEAQLQSALTKKISKLRGRLQLCDKELSLRQREIANLELQIQKQRDRLRQEEDQTAQSRLTELQEEISLLEQEYEDFRKNTEEIESELARLSQSLETKRVEESRLAEDLAMENMKGLNRATVASSQEGSLLSESAGHKMQSMVSLSRQRAESTPVEMYATFPFHRLVSSRHLAVAEPSGENPEGIFV